MEEDTEVNRLPWGCVARERSDSKARAPATESCVDSIPILGKTRASQGRE